MNATLETMTKSQTRAFWVSALSAVVSVLVSALALYISLKPQTPPSRQLSVALEHRADAYDATINEDWGMASEPMMTTEWNATIINASPSPMFITHYTVTASSAGYYKAPFYTELVTTDGRRCPLPYTLKPSEILAMRLFVPTGASSSICSEVKTALGVSPTCRVWRVKSDSMRKACAGHGLDIFGNGILQHPTDADFYLVTQRMNYAVSLDLFTHDGQSVSTVAWCDYFPLAEEGGFQSAK
jgi:hypothetical protein